MFDMSTGGGCTASISVRVPEQVLRCFPVAFFLPSTMNQALESINTHKAEVLLVLPNSLHLWSVQNNFIVRHGFLCIFLILFL